MFIDKSNHPYQLKLKDTSFLLLLLHALPLKTISCYCIYHVDAPGCITRAVPIGFKIAFNRSYSQQAIAKLGASVPLPQELGGEIDDKRNGAFYFSLSRLF